MPTNLIDFPGAHAARPWSSSPRRRSTTGQQRPEVRAALARSQRLLAVGMIVRSVSHELATPLAALLSNLGYATAGLTQAAGSSTGLAPEPARELLAALRDALEAADQIRTMAAELRTIARGEDEPDEVLALGRIVNRALALTRHELLPRAELELRLRPTPPVRGRAGRLVQVLVNLLVNAAQAFPPGERAGHRIVLSTEATPGWVALEVRDTGRGIPPEVLPRVFEPFFTTRAAEGGTGLGLSVSRSIVESMGGSIEVESAPGTGTAVRLLLPVFGGGPGA